MTALQILGAACLYLAVGIVLAILCRDAAGRRPSDRAAFFRKTIFGWAIILGIGFGKMLYEHSKSRPKDRTPRPA